jgi:hypothetical protein
MTEIIDNCSDTPKLSIDEIKRRMDENPNHRLMRVMAELEDLEGILHVFYRSACYESDCDGYVADEIFKAGIGDGGHMPMISMLSQKVKAICTEIKSVEASLPKDFFNLGELGSLLEQP